MDHIADLLARIKNATLAGNSEIKVSYSKMKEAILKILQSEGFISNINNLEEKNQNFLIAEFSREKKPGAEWNPVSPA